jgi:DNA-binding transcriptional ArsR family regulator
VSPRRPAMTLNHPANTPVGEMVLRIHFTADDLARVRIRVEPDPMWELVLSLHVLQAARAPAAYVGWRRHALRVIAAARLRDQVRPLTSLVAPQGDFPDFLTPTITEGVEAAIQTAVSTPRHRIRQELGALGTRRRTSGWLRSLADGRRETLNALAQALTVYQTRVIDSHDRQIRHAIHADWQLRVRDVLTGGTEHLLSNMPHPIVWRSPVLRADYPHDRDVHLRGRGLTLIPSYFCWGKPVTLIDPDLPPVLVYPVATAGGHPMAGTSGHSKPGPAGPYRSDQDLARLLGPARARALGALRTPGSTSELARRSGISITSASKHAGVLRGAGLITSIRRSNTVIHALTPLGRDLLDASRSQAESSGAGASPREGERS